MEIIAGLHSLTTICLRIDGIEFPGGPNNEGKSARLDKNLLIFLGTYSIFKNGSMFSSPEVTNDRDLREW